MTERYWSRFSEDYDERQAKVVGEDLLEAISDALNALPELGQVVELGCGTGYVTRQLIGKARSIVATDLSESQLDVAAAKFKEQSSVRFEKQDCTKTTLDGNAFDTVVVANVLHVIKNPAACVEECHRLLKDDGLLVVVSFTTFSLSVWEKIKMGARFLQAWGQPPEHTRVLSPERLRNLLEDVGFEVTEARLVGERTKAVLGFARKPPQHDPTSIVEIPI